MKPCNRQIALVCLLLLAALPAYAQHGTLGLDAGQTSDKFGGLTNSNSAVGAVNGEVVVLHGSEKEGRPNIVAGGEVRFPSDTNNHPNEYALFGGVIFRPNSSFSIGFHAQVHKISLPTSVVDNQFFARKNMEVVEIPLVLKYKFGPGKRLFLDAQGAPEFSPRWHNPTAGAAVLPNPNLDYAYFVRGGAGYNFGKWYVKGSYQMRYFKFTPNTGNPNGLYNWRSDFVTGGVGINF